MKYWTRVEAPGQLFGGGNSATFKTTSEESKIKSITFSTIGRSNAPSFLIVFATPEDANAFKSRIPAKFPNAQDEIRLSIVPTDVKDVDELYTVLEEVNPRLQEVFMEKEATFHSQTYTTEFKH